MKSFYLAIPIIFLFLFGCSTTNKVTDYPTKEEFYEEVNNTIKNRNTDIVTTDSSFTSLEGSKIEDDSLYAITNIQEKKEKIPLKDTKEIKYFGKSYEEPSAIILLKNGTELRRDNVKVLPDSSVQFTYVKITAEYIPLTNIKQVSYTNHWKGILPGFLIGTASGGVAGGVGLLGKHKTGGNQPEWNQAESIIVGSILGSVVGSIVGYIVGWNYNFQFNP